MECTQFIETPYIPDPNTGSHPRLHVAKLCINNDLSVLCHLFLQRGQWAFQSAVAWRWISLQFPVSPSLQCQVSTLSYSPNLAAIWQKRTTPGEGKIDFSSIRKELKLCHVESYDIALNTSQQAGHYPLQESRVQTSSHRIVPWRVFSPPPISRGSKILIFVCGRIEEISYLIIAKRKVKIVFILNLIFRIVMSRGV